MKVFLSWSGSRSRALATALRDWLPEVVQAAEPWISERDIGKGSRWRTELTKQLEQAGFGIICLTPENLAAPWILFEAGAISNHIGGFVCTYLLDLHPADLNGPLAEFQATKTTRQETVEMLRTLNGALGKRKLPDSQLERSFERCWPDLEKRIQAIPREEGERASPRNEREILEEILERVRGLSQFDAESYGRIQGLSSPYAAVAVNAWPDLWTSGSPQIDKPIFLSASKYADLLSSKSVVLANRPDEKDDEPEKGSEGSE